MSYYVAQYEVDSCLADAAIGKLLGWIETSTKELGDGRAARRAELVAWAQQAYDRIPATQTGIAPVAVARRPSDSRAWRRVRDGLPAIFGLG